MGLQLMASACQSVAARDIPEVLLDRLVIFNSSVAELIELRQE
ncbi:hypothetical protein [Microbulbifer okhotskensis]|nr:hypothetical protein [Microbulbifer okhotskensis]